MQQGKTMSESDRAWMDGRHAARAAVDTPRPHPLRRPRGVHHRNDPAAQSKWARLRRRGRHPAHRLGPRRDSRGPQGELRGRPGPPRHQGRRLRRADHQPDTQRRRFHRFPSPRRPGRGRNSTHPGQVRRREQASAPHRTTIMVTISEEVGYGASSGLSPKASPRWSQSTTRYVRPASTPSRTA